MHCARWILALNVLLAACAGTPGEPPPAGVSGGASTTPDPNARTLPIPPLAGNPVETSPGGAGSMVWNVPTTWKTVTPSNTMRHAQYEVTGSAGNGECVVFYFGPGQGGDPMANARRWAGQFTQPDGGRSEDEMSITEIEGGSLSVQLVEVQGTYDGGMSMGRAAPQPQPGWKLLGGIAEGPDAPWFFKFTGPQATVEENREAFVTLLRSIRQEI